jgi:hypothetical protein
MSQEPCRAKASDWRMLGVQPANEDRQLWAALEQVLDGLRRLPGVSGRCR